MAEITHSDIPFAIAPGETIREEIAARGQSVTELSEALGIDLSCADGLLSGETEITSALAEKLGSFFGTSASLWANLEYEYREALRSQKPALTDSSISSRQDVSGKFVVRVPKSLHLALKELSEAEGISLNQMVVAMLAESLGRSRARLS